MKKIILTFLCLSAILLSACHGLRPYQPDVQQGNVVTQEMMQQLKVGMTKDEVQNIVGLPILVDTFNTNHWAYTYTFQHRGGKITKKHLDLYFQNDRLSSIQDGRIEK